MRITHHQCFEVARRKCQPCFPDRSKHQTLSQHPFSISLELISPFLIFYLMRRLRFHQIQSSCAFCDDSQNKSNRSKPGQRGRALFNKKASNQFLNMHQVVQYVTGDSAHDLKEYPHRALCGIHSELHLLLLSSLILPCRTPPLNPMMVCQKKPGRHPIP